VPRVKTEKSIEVYNLNTLRYTERDRAKKRGERVGESFLKRNPAVEGSGRKRYRKGRGVGGGERMHN
jgi:hypothetical protein